MVEMALEPQDPKEERQVPMGLNFVIIHARMNRFFLIYLVSCMNLNMRNVKLGTKIKRETSLNLLGCDWDTPVS